VRLRELARFGGFSKSAIMPQDGLMACALLD